VRIAATVAAVSVAALIGAAVACAAEAPGAPVRSFPAVADAHVSAAHPRASYGRARMLLVRARPRARAYVTFRVPLRARAGRVTLRVRAKSSSRSGFIVRRSFTRLPTRLTYGLAPRLGYAFKRSGPIRAGAWVEVDVTRLFWRGGNVTLGLTARRGSVRLASRNSRAAPRLVVRPDAGRPADPAASAAHSYLDNGIVRVGVDLARGGTITYLAQSGGGENVINNYDLGRQVQQSYYAGPQPYGNPSPPWQNMPWNPVGTGDMHGNPSQVLAHANDGTTLYVRSVPKQWALRNVACECVFEQWITLDGRAVRVQNRLTNYRADTTQYPAMTQELPAVYTIGKLHRLVAYRGTNPFGGEPFEQVEPLADGVRFHATENWAALVNDSGWGLGVFQPDVARFYAKFFGTRNTGATSDFATGYMAPNTEDVLDHNVVYPYRYALVLGSVDEIRAYAAAHRQEIERVDWDFEEGRDHWWYVNATGPWNASGTVVADLSRNDPQLHGPETLWSSVDVPKLYIRAAYRNTNATTAELFWRGPGEEFSGARSIRFPVTPDGQFRTYEVDLSSVPTYAGPVAQLRLDPTTGAEAGSSVEIDYIAPSPR
jgi:hypothetical protein